MNFIVYSCSLFAADSAIRLSLSLLIEHAYERHVQRTRDYIMNKHILYIVYSYALLYICILYIVYKYVNKITCVCLYGLRTAGKHTHTQR